MSMYTMHKYQMISWEFFHGTVDARVANPIEESFKIIYDVRKALVYVFHEKGKNAFPVWKEPDGRRAWDYFKLQIAASRVCIQEADGSFKCLKSRVRRPYMEDPEEILDIAKSKLEYSVKTGLEPAEVYYEDIQELYYEDIWEL